MKIPFVKSQSEVNDCPPLSCDKKHRKAAPNVVGTKQRIKRLLLFISVIVYIPVFVYSQNEEQSDSTRFFTLEQCIHYGMQHQPGLNRSLLNTSIAKTTNAINLSGWLPQVNLIGSMIHYNQLPTTLAANPVPGGTAGSNAHRRCIYGSSGIIRLAGNIPTAASLCGYERFVVYKAGRTNYGQHENIRRLIHQ